MVSMSANLSSALTVFFSVPARAPGKVADQVAECLLRGCEHRQPDRAIGQQRDGAVRLGGEDGEHGLLQDVEVLPVVVELAAVLGQYLRQAAGARTVMGRGRAARRGQSHSGRDERTGRQGGEAGGDMKFIIICFLLLW